MESALPCKAAHLSRLTVTWACTPCACSTNLSVFSIERACEEEGLTAPMNAVTLLPPSASCAWCQQQVYLDQKACSSVNMERRVPVGCSHPPASHHAEQWHASTLTHPTCSRCVILERR